MVGGDSEEVGAERPRSCGRRHSLVIDRRRRGGGQANGHPSGAGRGDDGVATGAFQLAAPTRYLPARSGCVTVRHADVDGDGQPDRVIVYSRLGRRHPSGYVSAVPPSLGSEFIGSAAFLKVVLANGTAVSARIRGIRAALDAIAHVNEDPGKEIFLEVERISSGEKAVAYGLHGGRLIPVGITLSYGGDSGSKAGFDCLAGNPPQVIQHAYELIGGSASGCSNATERLGAAISASGMVASPASDRSWASDRSRIELRLGSEDRHPDRLTRGERCSISGPRFCRTHPRSASSS